MDDKLRKEPIVIDRKEFGRIVASERAYHGWTQSQLARLVGTSKSTISRIEVGDSEKIREFDALANKLALPFVEVAKYLDQSNQPTLFGVKPVSCQPDCTVDFIVRRELAKRRVRKPLWMRILNWRIW